TMLADSLLPTIFWTKVVATACYVLNRLLVAKPHNTTPYELLTGNQGQSSNNTGCQDSDSDSDNEQDVIIVQNSPTPVTIPVHDVPNHEEAAQSVLSPSLDLNDNDMEELSSFQNQEQEGNDAAQRLGLAFPTHVVSNEASSIPAEKSSSVSPASTPTASAGNTPPVSPRPLAGRSSKSTGKKLASSSKTSIPAGRSVFADKPIPAGRSVFADKPIPAGRYVSADKSITAVSTGIFSSSSYDDEYIVHDISNQEKEILVNPVTTKKVNEAHPHSLIIGDLHTPVQTRKKAKAQGSMQLGQCGFSRIKGMQGELSAEIKQGWLLKVIDKKKA
nr:putative ribonuclease H-like domain-containing protein [Tanacetum cinerariifolium]